MSQVVSQASEVGRDGVVEFVFHVNTHPLVHIARGQDSTEVIGSLPPYASRSRHFPQV